MRCAVPIISLSEYIVHINEKQAESSGHGEGGHKSVNAILRAFGVTDGGGLRKRVARSLTPVRTCSK